MTAINSIIDRLRLASLLTILGAAGGLYALIAGEIDYNEFMVSLGALSAGTGLLGMARVQGKIQRGDKE